MHSFAKPLRAAIGTCSPVKLFARCLLTGAVLLMSLPARPQASLLESAPLTLATKTQPGSDNVPYTPPIKSMTSEQQQQMLETLQVGMKWIQGAVDFNKVKQALGFPTLLRDDIEQKYVFVVGHVLTAEFYFDKTRLVAASPVVERFVLTVDTYFEPHIRMSDYEQRLGLHRLIRGEKIDGVRTEISEFFNPGIRCVDCDRNSVLLGYSLPLPPDSLFDVYGNFNYLGKNDAPDYRSHRDPENLREITFTRTYLTPKELDERNAARREKYGMMNLRTGMLCPETAIWKGWTKNGATDELVVYAGRLFPTARNEPYEKPVPFEWVDARWMRLSQNLRESARLVMLLRRKQRRFRLC
jgi:hypothetical protein